MVFSCVWAAKAASSSIKEVNSKDQRGVTQDWYLTKFIFPEYYFLIPSIIFLTNITQYLLPLNLMKGFCLTH